MLSQTQSPDWEAEEADSQPLLQAWEEVAQCPSWEASLAQTPMSPLLESFCLPAQAALQGELRHVQVECQEEEQVHAPQLHLLAPQGLPSLIGMFPLSGVMDDRGC